jgi:hypothetical protein
MESPLKLRRIRPSDRVNVLTVAVTVGLTAFLVTQPAQSWLLLVVVVLAGFGIDGIVRSHPASSFQSPAESAPFLFLPVLYVLGVGLFFEYTATGYWTVLAGLVAGLGFGIVAHAESICVDETDRRYGAVRFVLNILTYLTTFAFFAVIYSFDIDLLPSALAIGLVTLLMAVEVIRESDVDTGKVLAYGIVIGIVLGEARWALHFLPLDGFLAAVFLLLAFYLVTGLFHAYLTRQLTRATVLEFAVVTALGTAMVAAAHLILE